MVIHQPRFDIFTMLDDLVLLAKGGDPVYLGPRAKATSYFESLGYTCPAKINPADFVIDIIDTHRDSLVAAWKAHGGQVRTAFPWLALSLLSLSTACCLPVSTVCCLSETACLYAQLTVKYLHGVQESFEKNVLTRTGRYAFLYDCSLRASLLSIFSPPPPPPPPPLACSVVCRSDKLSG